MTFLQMQQLAADLTGLDQTDSTTATKLKRWLNEAYKLVASLENWPWLFKRDVVQTSVDITTGTVSVTNGLTTGTFSAGPTLAGANTDWKIQFSGDPNWYDVSSVSGTSLTLTDAFLGTTNATSTYTLRRYFYSLPSDVDRIVSIKQTVSDQELTYVPNFSMDSILPDPIASGDPRIWSFQGLNSSNAWRISVYPFPSTQINLELSYYRRITELSADADLTLMPDPWNQVLVHAACLFFGYTFIDDDRRKDVKEAYEYTLGEMRKKLIPASRATTVKLPWDRVPSPRGIRTLQLPSDYPRQ